MRRERDPEGPVRGRTGGPYTARCTLPLGPVGRVVLACLGPESREPMPRASFSCEAAEAGPETILLTVVADDATALRAALNTCFRLVDLAVRTLGAVEPLPGPSFSLDHPSQRRYKPS